MQQVKDIWVNFDHFDQHYSNYHRIPVIEIKFPPFWSRVQRDCLEQVSVRVEFELLQYAEVIREFLGIDVIVALVTPLYFGYEVITTTSGRGKKKPLMARPKLTPGDIHQYWILIPSNGVSKQRVREARRMVKMISQRLQKYVDEKIEDIKRLSWRL